MEGPEDGEAHGAVGQGGDATAKPEGTRPLGDRDGSDPGSTVTRAEGNPPADGGSGLRRWGRFRCVRLLGRGGMGTVYEAHDPKLDRRVALKVLRDDDPDAVRRFVREARAQARMHHETICPIHEVGEEDGSPYIVMQLIGGTTLDEAAERMTLEQKLLVLARVASAVHEAHRAGLVHRDLKPSNIMVEESDDGTLRPFVLDFGIARDRSDPGLTSEGAFLGTPAYAAPEQIRGDVAAVDRRTDVYSLGATLYSLLAGGAPFTGPTPGVMLDVLNAQPRSLRDRGIPADVETIVFTCLEKEPARRYGSARALAEDLRRFLDGDPILARPAGFFGRLRRRARKNPAAWGIGVAASILLVIALVWGGVSRWQARARERIVRDLTAEVTAIELNARLAHLSPQHDIRPDRRRIHDAIAGIVVDLDGVGDEMEGVGSYALGRGYLAINQLEEARQFLERAWERGYREPEVSHALGVTLSLLYREALTELETIVDAELREVRREELRTRLQRPAVEHMVRSRGSDPDADQYLAALIAFHEGRLDEAIRLITTAPARDPWGYDADLLLGDVHRERAVAHRDAGEADAAHTALRAALDAYGAALEVARSDPGIHLAAGQVHLLIAGLDQFTADDVEQTVREGLHHAVAAVAIAPDDPRPRALEARLHCREAENLRHGMHDPTPSWDRALAAAEQAGRLADDPTEALKLTGLIHCSRAHFLQATGDSDAQRAALGLAIDALDRVGAGERDYDFYNTLGSAHASRGDLEARSGRDARGSYDRAMSAYRHALDLHPAPGAAYRNLYACFLKLSALPEVENRVELLRRAVDAFETAADIDPTDPVPHYYLGRCYLALAQEGDPHSQRLGPEANTALEHYRLGQQLNPKLPHFASGIGEVLFLQAQQAWDAGEAAEPLLDRAEAAFRRGLEINPDFIYLQLNLSWATYYRGKYRVREGRDGTEALEAAIAHAEDALALASHDGARLCIASARRMLAERELLAGGDPRRWLEAGRARIIEILDGNPEHVAAHRSLGRMRTLEARWLARSGADPRPAFAASARALARALELKPDGPAIHLAESRRCLREAEWLQTQGEAAGEVIARGLTQADRALELRPGWPEARVVRAVLRRLSDDESVSGGVRRELERALAANPHLVGEWSGYVDRGER